MFQIYYTLLTLFSPALMILFHISNSERSPQGSLCEYRARGRNKALIIHKKKYGGRGRSFPDVYMGEYKVITCTIPFRC